MVGHQAVQYPVGPGAAVKQVPHNMQPVHRQPFDDLAQPGDVGIRPVMAHNAVDDLAVVKVLVVVLKMGVEQLVQNIGTALGQTGAHMGAGVLTGHKPAQFDEPQQGGAVPAGQVGLAGFQFRQFLGGIVDQGGQLGPFRRRHFFPQHKIDLFVNDTRCTVEDMHKGFVFPVQVAHKMLGALGQPQHRFDADDLAGGRHRGGAPGQQAQIAQMFTVSRHGQSPFRYRTRQKPPAGTGPGPAWRWGRVWSPAGRR